MCSIVCFNQVICNDCDSLVMKSLSARAMNPHDSTVLVGLDDGQGFLKLCVTIQSNRADNLDQPDSLEGEGGEALQARAHYSEVGLPHYTPE